MTFDRIVEKLAIPSVLAIFLAVPLAAWTYDKVYIPSQYPNGCKVFTLYWSGEKGITLKRVNGLNYWLPWFDRLKELKVREGDRVIFRLISTDTHHGFALPAFGITEALIMPGDVTTVDFVADKVGSFPFFCTIRCGRIHDNLEANLTVMPTKGRPG